MPRTGITVYLPRQLEERIARIANEERRSASSIVAEAVKAKFDGRLQDAVAISLRNGAKVEARLDKLIGEILITKEIMLLFVRVWMEHNPPLDPDVEESAAASADARFERFLDFVAQSLAPGRSNASPELITASLDAPAERNGGALP